MRVLDSFMRLARNLQAGDIDFENARDSDDPNTEKLITEKPLDQANSVSSRIIDTLADDSGSTTFKTGMHKIVIDLDVDAALWETTTPGHHHLIIGHPLTWEQYKELLVCLNKFGLIQDGYLHACLAREASWIRTPWTKKQVAQ
jgi:hypothetical protein